MGKIAEIFYDSNPEWSGKRVGGIDKDTVKME